MLNIEKQDALASASPVTTLPRALHLPQASSYSGIGRSKLYALLNARKIKSYKVGAARLIDRASLDAFLDTQVA